MYLLTELTQASRPLRRRGRCWRPSEPPRSDKLPTVMVAVGVAVGGAVEVAVGVAVVQSPGGVGEVAALDIASAVGEAPE